MAQVVRLLAGKATFCNAPQHQLQRPRLQPPRRQLQPQQPTPHTDADADADAYTYTNAKSVPVGPRLLEESCECLAGNIAHLG